MASGLKASELMPAIQAAVSRAHTKAALDRRERDAFWFDHLAPEMRASLFKRCLESEDSFVTFNLMTLPDMPTIVMEWELVEAGAHGRQVTFVVTPKDDDVQKRFFTELDDTIRAKVVRLFSVKGFTAQFIHGSDEEGDCRGDRLNLQPMLATPVQPPPARSAAAEEPSADPSPSV